MSEFQSLVNSQPKLPAYSQLEPSAANQDTPPYYANERAYSVNSASDAAGGENNDSSERQHCTVSKFFSIAFSCCRTHPNLSANIIGCSLILVIVGITAALTYIAAYQLPGDD